jgi:hypothetical protein
MAIMSISIDPEILRRIAAIDWFVRCGNGGAGCEISDIIWVTTWLDARCTYSRQEWEDMRLDARNTLTVHLFKRYQNEYAEWRRVADAITKHAVFVDAMAKVEAFKARHGLDQQFFTRVQWDVFNAVMESAYAKCRPPHLFYTMLLKVYEAGHFPCGWEGEWPAGRLMAI